MNRTKTIGFRIIFALAILLWHAEATNGQDIKLDITPDQLYERMANNPSFKENFAGEAFCWHARSGMDQFVDNYEVTKNPAWLDAGVRYSADGKEKLASLLKTKRQMNIFEWAGKDPLNKKPYKGDYRIRWTLGNGYREFPITIK